MLANVLAWSAQVTMIVAAAGITLRLLRVTDARARLWTWHGVLITALLLPLAQPWAVEMSIVNVPVAGDAADARTIAAAGAATMSVNWAQVTLTVIAIGALSRMAMLIIGAMRLRQVRRQSTPWVPQPWWLENAKAGAAAKTIVHLSGDVSSAVAFGWRRPSVLAPVRLVSSPDPEQRAVIAHELLHVTRRDWPVLVAEECVRAVLWFHPAVWLAVSEAQLAREEAVDRLVVDATGDARHYVDALLAAAEGTPRHALIPAPQFIRRRQLVTRINRLLKESRMSQSKLVQAGLTLALVVGATSWASTAMFPLGFNIDVEALAAKLPSLTPQPEPPPLPPPPPKGMRAYGPGGKELTQFGPVAPEAPQVPLEPRRKYRKQTPPRPPAPPPPPPRLKAVPPAPPEAPAPPSRQKPAPPAPPEPPAPPPVAPRWTEQAVPPPPPPPPPAPPRIKRGGIG